MNVIITDFLSRLHQLPDASLDIRLLLDFYPIDLINSTVEVLGEVRLYEAAKRDSDDFEIESSHSLIHKLRELQLQLETEKNLPSRPPSGTNDKSLHHDVRLRLQQEIVYYKTKYKPIIQVNSLRHMTEARGIIAENLHYRQIQQYKKSLSHIRR